MAANERTWFNVSGRRRLSIVRQASAAECGLACIAMLAQYHGAGTDLTELRRRHESSLRGATLLHLARICAREGLQTRALTCNVDDLKSLPAPCIVHWGFNHFVVLQRRGRRRFTLYDPARGVVEVSRDEVERQFTGVVLEVTAVADLKASAPTPGLRVGDLVRGSTGLWRGVSMGMLLALLCEGLLLTTPLYLQAVIDGVIQSGDDHLLWSLVLAFSVLLLFQLAATVLRSLTFQHLGLVTVFDMAGRVLRRLTRLPHRYFRVREMGDIQHRFQALGQVQAFVTRGLPQLIVDTLFFVLIGALMLSYDATLTLLNVAAALLWVAWSAAIFGRRRRQQQDMAQAEAATQTHFLETLRAMPSIRSSAGETQRCEEWRSLFANSINARIRIGNLQIVDGAVRQCLFQGARLATIYGLALRGLDGSFTVGMISAFAAWLGMFSTRTAGLVKAVFAYRLLQVPLERLSDIVFSGDESDEVATDVETDRMLGRIELRDVDFSYSRHESAVIRGCNLEIAPGSFVAIAGASGCGKSTLLRLIAGVERPTAGTLHYDGASLAPASVRRKVATLFQDDALLRGTVAENIALFDGDANLATIRRAARAAAIDDVIMRLPMGYHSRISDLGSTLSFGQQQRVLLARAFCRNAELMLLDEPTGSLDLQTEKHVVAALQRSDATRIVVSHSDRVLSAADRVLWLRDGSLVSSPPILSVRGER